MPTMPGGSLEITLTVNLKNSSPNFPICKRKQITHKKSEINFLK